MQMEEVNMCTRSTRGTSGTDKYYTQALFVPLPRLYNVYSDCIYKSCGSLVQMGVKLKFSIKGDCCSDKDWDLIMTEFVRSTVSEVCRCISALEAQRGIQCVTVSVVLYPKDKYVAH